MSGLVMGSGASYELVCFAVFLVTVLGVWRVWRRDRDRGESLAAVLLVGLFFGVGWEPQGTELVWSYPGYRLYAFMDIPLALLLSWSWWMVACSLVAGRLEAFLSRVLGRANGLAFVVSAYLSGVLAAMIIEPLSVAMGWWDYLVVGENAVVRFPVLGVEFNLTVIVGWGLLTVLNLALARKAVKWGAWLEGGTGWRAPLPLGLACAVFGLFSGWLSWQLVGFYAALVEGAEPMIFFTRYYIFVLEGVSAAQLIALLTVASGAAFYLWKRRAPK
ncbi:MAG: hypothetical protein NWE88_07890 [Candidatus Bathyarchaeota archaeon]|nr:hypothetical protein [Candidatus Bathyarchaeota archaeon]